MNIFGIGNKPKQNPKYAVWILTTEGEKRAERFDLPQKPAQVVDELKGNPSTAGDIAMETGLDEDKVVAILLSLSPRFCKMGAGGEGDG